MAKMTIGFGALLAILGVLGFVLTGSAHPTALIPCWFGLALVVCGALASTPDVKRRMLWMHMAVTIGMLGWLIPLYRALNALRHEGTGIAFTTQHPQMLDYEAMILVCLVFTVLCVRSFIAARRDRVA